MHKIYIITINLLKCTSSSTFAIFACFLQFFATVQSEEATLMNANLQKKMNKQKKESPKYLITTHVDKKVGWFGWLAGCLLFSYSFVLTTFSQGSECVAYNKIYYQPNKRVNVANLMLNNSCNILKK